MNLEVHSISRDDYKEWLLKKHYAKRLCSVSYAFGLYINNVLSGVCTFGKPASNQLCVGVCGKENSKYVYELNRLCVNDNLPKNTLSKFLSNCLKMLPNLIIVSYADTKMNHYGYIYQATNWLYTGKTKERTDIGTDSDKHSRHYDKSIDYSKNRKVRSSKHRYIYFTGNKRLNKSWLKSLNYKTEPYPKGENKRYDASYKPNIQLSIL